MIRITLETDSTIARYTVATLDEKAHRVYVNVMGATLRDLAKLGILHADVESLRICESRDFNIQLSEYQARVLNGIR